MATSTAAQARAHRINARAPGCDTHGTCHLMPIGPLAIAVVRGILPYNTTDSNTAMAARVAAHQGTEMIVIWLTFVALLTLIPGVIALGHARQARHSPGWGRPGSCWRTPRSHACSGPASPARTTSRLARPASA